MIWYPLSSRFWSLRWRWSLWRGRLNRLSPEDISAWSSFYLQESRDGVSLPLEAFARQLLAHGIPDLGNPLSRDTEDYFLLHEGGFLAGEIDRALRPAESEVDQQRSRAALDRLGLLLHLGCPMVSARSYWADEDVLFACALSLAEGRWELFGARAPEAIFNALTKGLLEPAVAPGLLIARKLFDSFRYPAPWRRAASSRRSAGASSPLTTPAPELDLASWRSKRVSTAPSPDDSHE